MESWGALEGRSHLERAHPLLYLLTFLVDERGQSIRNNIAHGLAASKQFSQGLSDQTLHSVLALSLVRDKSIMTDITRLFQYGSNCDIARLNSDKRLRGAATNPILVETVDEYDLEFSVWSNGNNCAASNLAAAPGTGRRAWGILYEVPTDRMRGKRDDGLKTMAQITGVQISRRPVGSELIAKDLWQ